MTGRVLTEIDYRRLGNTIRAVEQNAFINYSRRQPVCQGGGDFQYPKDRKSLISGVNNLTRPDRNLLLWWDEAVHGPGECIINLPSDPVVNDTFFLFLRPTTTDALIRSFGGAGVPSHDIIMPEAMEATGPTIDHLCHGYYFDSGATGEYARQQIYLPPIASGSLILTNIIIQYTGIKQQVMVGWSGNFYLHQGGPVYATHTLWSVFFFGYNQSFIDGWWYQPF